MVLTLYDSIIFTEAIKICLVTFWVLSLHFLSLFFIYSLSLLLLSLSFWMFLTLLSTLFHNMELSTRTELWCVQELEVLNTSASFRLFDNPLEPTWKLESTNPLPVSLPFSLKSVLMSPNSWWQFWDSSVLRISTWMHICTTCILQMLVLYSYLLKLSVTQFCCAHVP